MAFRAGKAGNIQPRVSEETLETLPTDDNSAEIVARYEDNLWK